MRLVEEGRLSFVRVTGSRKGEITGGRKREEEGEKTEVQFVVESSRPVEDRQRRQEQVTYD